MRQKVQGIASAWNGEVANLIVVCIDLHNSMAARGYRDAVDRSEIFLGHNALVHEICESWVTSARGPTTDIELVNFSGDAALVTLAADAADEALEFALEVVERVRRTGSETAIGMDIGEVAIVTIARNGMRGIRPFRQATGLAVDRAVRLSWIARPGEILATGALTATLPSVGQFTLMPAPGPVGISLDKWPTPQVELGGSVLVHSIGRAEDSRRPLDRPANMRVLSEYFRQLQLAALDFLRESPRKWRLVIDVFGRPERWTRREALEDFLNLLMSSVPLDGADIPELDGVGTVDGYDPIATFREWRENMITYIRDMIGRYHELTLSEVTSMDFTETMDRTVSELVLFSRAHLRRMELAG